MFLNVAQDAVLGILNEDCTVPTGTAERGVQDFSRPYRDCTDRLDVDPGLTSWATFRRPFGTIRLLHN